MYKMLEIDLGLSQQDLKTIIPIMGALIGFIIFWFTQKSEKLKQKLIDKYGEDQGSAKLIIYTKFLGGFTMGVLPVTAFLIAFPETSILDLGLGFREDTLMTTIVWSVGLIALIVPLVALSARKPENLVNYPQIRAKVWDRKMVINNFAAWAAYLFGYEFLFRGVLLFPLVATIGLWPAIAINIAIYSGTHIPKGATETIGAIPLSIVLCLLSVQTGTIWIAFFLHVAMAWTNTTVALRYHPEMNYQKKIKTLV